MADLIDRQAAIEKLKRKFNEMDVPDRYPGIFDAIEEWLSECELPSAQPVLTCKGCKYDYYECVQCRNCLRKERDLYEPE